jgi:phosphoribosylformimino-5-aminoimidazole carboxamide ribotide isomerase
MMTIIPAMDIIGGKCVRLTRGDFDTKKVYDNDPLAVAKRFEDIGVQRLHMVDLDGARQKHVVNHDVLEKVAANTSLMIDFGGGLQSENDICIAFDSGANQITAGSIAVKNKSMVKSWLEKYGVEKIILGADVSNHKIVISGWQEQTDIDIESFLREQMVFGFKYAICTDVSRDGVLQGPAIGLYRSLTDKLPDLQLIASGGVSKIDDLVLLSDSGVSGVIIGKALYEGHIKLEELKPFLC